MNWPIDLYNSFLWDTLFSLKFLIIHTIFVDIPYIALNLT